MVRPAAWPRPIPKGHSWRTLVGEGWTAYVRVLHPASHWVDGVEHPTGGATGNAPRVPGH